MEQKIKAKIIDAEGVQRTIVRLAHEVIERNRGVRDIVVIGLRTRGVAIGRRLVEKVKEIEKTSVPFGVLDVTLYRDDFRRRLKQPVVQVSDIPFDIDEKQVILVDDVLYTGRTLRAALDALMDLGRPASVQVVVLVDRGHREMPIRADYVGKNIPTSVGEEIQVRLKEEDGEDCVLLVEAPEEAL
ncbi:MAG TPA: bifunctional pyr operon transcriptional regulator/uracil phosphoribosyltransferase PyrR [bacterium]|jgi:pyrimidine operon attenuation protein/uracil phosphoribosyltransferase|nr:bifunctional pyr operon transcriptional regulator/uracil phosphoribosyltransferase PyrR [bacterium]HNT64795.1 bifunctional pyr operon transcriptional regulator/uracil phosphoribosyltransferase PyrR [bacterium]HOX85956.1 bifunctional pyr operon transcriptional regulator/uracil phosphoribosyltransferase PyrR [bacterium]HPG45061.1 bifunctional pyr operon transcriptional regulator/uracil phosphoribosyltransferase PyrR [bacterium]HPM97303.1 bifunctional pyr operon transcriptional regulator/uracil